MRFALATVLNLILMSALLATDKSTGQVVFTPQEDQSNIPEAYRLDAHEFPYEMNLKKSFDKEGYQLFEVRFPSAVTTKFPENNTVHCQWYKPLGNGPFPTAVVLDILGGDQSLARVQSAYLVRKGIACLFVQMAYYGPRRPANSKVRLLMPDVDHSLAAVRQTVLDIRRASAWLASRPEVDKQRLGVIGTSLGSFMGTLTAEMEPRFKKVAIVLGGGGVVDAFYDHPKGAAIRLLWESLGGTKEKLKNLIAVADPITCASNLKDRQVIMIAASKDEIVPPSACKKMWEALGQPKIVWYDAGHYTAVYFIYDALQHVIAHFKN